MKYCTQWTYDPIGIKSMSWPSKKPIRPDEEFVIKEVCEVYEVSPFELRLRARNRRIIEPKQVAMSLLRRYFPLKSLKNIGELFNNDHSTVIYALETVEGFRLTNRIYRERYQQLVDKLDPLFNSEI